MFNMSSENQLSSTDVRKDLYENKYYNQKDLKFVEEIIYIKTCDSSTRNENL